ncbi:DNA methyltransferase [Dietzia sp. SL131]|uniref:type ISP restriction/modification enzyme n=1 Tax=Dietzia sp. SL131 TaxID=2995149 RepID=UPI00227B7826|nr:type ISP restriction/modification enzyme [Dietzia sp. SL131]MCY1659269.1 DNA methyltransferase [Dietzia sp. SL131]
MREYLRRTATHGWIINVTPEGKQPPAANAVFNIETPVAIALFLRGEASDEYSPAEIRYIDIDGTRKEKFEALSHLTFDDPSWRSVRTEWTAPFTPAAATTWDDYPAVDDLLPWRNNGIMAGRGWVYAPSVDILEARLRDVINEDNAQAKAEKFLNADNTSLTKTKKPLPGVDTEQGTRRAFQDIPMLTQFQVVRCGYRVLDRQYVIADSRLLNRPSPKLWHGRVPDQIFAYELHSEYPRTGPGLVYTDLIPDVHHFRGSGGGRALPKIHPDGTPNLAPGLTAALRKHFGQIVSDEEVFDYIAGIAGHSGFVAQFDDELHTPGIRIPITTDARLWKRAVGHGRHLQWLQTYGAAGAHPKGYTDVRDCGIGTLLPSYEVAVGPGIPTSWSYNPATQTLHVGPGRWENVTREATEYVVGGANVLTSWLNYRMAAPKKRYTSPLDDINATHWSSSWSTELTELLSILTQLVNLEDQMADLLIDVIAAPQLTKDDLAGDGVKWPISDADRQPRLVTDGTLDLR